jgi:hypothetical protein
MEPATCDNEFASVRACASQQTSGPLVRLLAAIGAVSSVAMIALLNLHY